jgi:hypothetical protein
VSKVVRSLRERGTDRSYFYNRGFDNVFIFGTLALALALGGFASISPATLLAVIFLNVWIFANPHVVATYTRIGASKTDVKRHWFLIFVLPIFVLVGVTIIALSYEVSGLFTIYIITQTYHVSRQSFGIARAYRRVDRQPLRADRLSEVLIYTFPLWGLLNWCVQQPDSFLGYPVSLPFVSPMLVQIVGIISVAAGVLWVIRQWRTLLVADFNRRHDWFVLSHVCVFSVAYVWINDITLGWLIVNIWHNIQYLLFVWMKNIKRDTQPNSILALPRIFGDIGSIDAFPWRNAGKYLVVCLVCGALVYEVFDSIGRNLLWLGLPTVLIMHFTVNFHHYLVDGIIWKRRGQPQA